MEILKKKFINFIVLLLGVVLALTPFIVDCLLLMLELGLL